MARIPTTSGLSNLYPRSQLDLWAHKRIRLPDLFTAVGGVFFYRVRVPVQRVRAAPLRGARVPRTKHFTRLKCELKTGDFDDFGRFGTHF